MLCHLILLQVQGKLDKYIKTNDQHVRVAAALVLNVAADRN